MAREAWSPTVAGPGKCLIPEETGHLVSLLAKESCVFMLNPERRSGRLLCGSEEEVEGLSEGALTAVQM